MTNRLEAYPTRRINKTKEAMKYVVQVESMKSASGIIQDDIAAGVAQINSIHLEDDDCYKVYEGNDWVFAVVNRIVRDCVKATPKIVPKDPSRIVSGRLSKRIKDVQAFLDNPNNNKESFSSIREKTIKNLLIYGRGAIEKVNTGSGILVELYSQDPKDLKIKTDEHGNIPQKNAYVLEHPFNLKGARKSDVYFDIDELIYVILLPTTKTMYGDKILDAIANSVASDILRASFNSNFFLNNAESSGVLSLEEMSKAELTKFKSEWQKNFKGHKNAHKLAIVNTPVNFARMALTNRDMQFSEYGDELRTKIFSAFGMQPFVMGIVDGTTGKLNSQQQMDLYKDAAIRPILSKEQFYYTEEIIKMGFGYDDIKVDFPSIDLADIETQSRIDIADLTAGVTVINEVRAKRNLAPVPWGNTPISVLPGGGQVDPNSGKLIPPSEQGSSSEKKPKPKKILEDYLISCRNALGAVSGSGNFDESHVSIFNDNDENLTPIKSILCEEFLTCVGKKNFADLFSKIDKLLHELRKD